jgi:hypothetical protein
VRAFKEINMFQDFNSKALARAGPPVGPQTPAEQASALIGRFPHLSEVELARLINLYRELPMLEVALMLSNKRLAPRMDEFMERHRAAIRAPFRQYAFLLAYIALGLGVLIWALAKAT